MNRNALDHLKHKAHHLGFFLALQCFSLLRYPPAEPERHIYVVTMECMPGSGENLLQRYLVIRLSYHLNRYFMVSLMNIRILLLQPRHLGLPHVLRP